MCYAKIASSWLASTPPGCITRYRSAPPTCACVYYVDNHHHDDSWLYAFNALWRSLLWCHTERITITMSQCVTWVCQIPRQWMKKIASNHRYIGIIELQLSASGFTWRWACVGRCRPTWWAQLLSSAMLGSLYTSVNILCYAMKGMVCVILIVDMGVI